MKMKVAGSRRTLVTTQDTMQCHNADNYSSEVSRTINKQFGGRGGERQRRGSSISQTSAYSIVTSYGIPGHKYNCFRLILQKKIFLRISSTQLSFEDINRYRLLFNNEVNCDVSQITQKGGNFIH